MARNEVAKINCEIEANPPALEFRWKFNNTSESTEIERHHFTVEGGRSTITFTPSSQRDYGTLLCWAKNSWGTQKPPCVYHVIPAGEFVYFTSFFYLVFFAILQYEVVFNTISYNNMKYLLHNIIYYIILFHNNS